MARNRYNSLLESTLPSSLSFINFNLNTTKNSVELEFNLEYTVNVDKDTNMFQRKHFEQLESQLRKDKDGNHLEIVDFKNSKLKNLDLSGLDLSNFDFSKSYLKDIDFSNCILNKCNFEKATIHSCNFSGVYMKPGSLFHIKAKNCNFSNATLSGYLKCMEVENCNFNNTTFGGLLTGVDFSSCKMVNYKTDGHTELSGLILPK